MFNQIRELPTVQNYTCGRKCRVVIVAAVGVIEKLSIKVT